MDPEIVSEANLDPSSALSAALGRLGSDSIWQIHVRRTYGLHGSKIVYISAPANMKLVPDSFHACIKKLGGGQRTRLTRNRFR